METALNNLSASSGMKKILFFGFYDRNYSRTKILRNGFERNGWTVEECHVDVRKFRGISKYFKLLSQGLSVSMQGYDLVLVPFPGHASVPLARMLFGKEILFDAFLSLYESNVLDREHYSPSSWKAKRDRFLDLWGCRLSGRILMDTQSNIEYFVKEYGLPREKFIRVFVGADDDVFLNKPTPPEQEFTVHFHGTFIPVQGIRYIIDAIDLLKDKNIHFRIIGHGQESEKIDAEIEKRGLTGVIERSPKVPIEKIAQFMAGAHITLGIFGEIDRARRAIPNKVYEAMAMGKAIITEDGSGVRELPDPEKMFVLVPPGNGQSIAVAILMLKNDPAMAQRLAENAKTFFVEHLMPEKLVAELLENLYQK